MGYDDAMDLFEYWKDWPPAHEVAHLIGVGLRILRMPARGTAPGPLGAPDDPSGIGALIAANPDGVVKAR